MQSPAPNAHAVPSPIASASSSVRSVVTVTNVPSTASGATLSVGLAYTQKRRA
ncbi:hypothetical protein UA18_06111 [Burkholderia multivorans]|uniref:Uncharacterized protein n=1 Tax=Burkholderia multivorans TaxID=87883 RepID=A0ABD7LE62_9BURK|nr:hypothetical protein UA17_05757 [Burkholderia multivorans]SAK03452.1 hypothetical protein UA18_06111 [Burkholderia multivorans]